MRILLLFTCYLFCLCTSAQIRIGGQAGYSRVTWVSVDPVSNPNTDYKYNTSGQDGFQNGIVVEIKVSNRWYLRPTLFVTGKGTWMNSKTWIDSSSAGIWVRYIELPIAAIYQLQLSNKLSGFAGGGGYAAYGIRGVVKGQGKSFNGQYQLLSALQFANHLEGNGFQIPPGIINRFDFGLTFLAGIERKNIQFLVTYSRGLKRLLPNGEPYNGNYANNSITFSLAYLVSTKSIKKWF